MSLSSRPSSLSLSSPRSPRSPSSPSPTSPGGSPVRRRHRFFRALAALAAVAFVALGGVASVASAPWAAAHDELTGTVPADRSTVATAPDLVVLHFTEAPVTVGLAVRVTGPTGDVRQGTPRVTGHDVVQPLLPRAPAGDYRVAWRVTADDGHASSGELTFTASAPSARQATATPRAGAVTPTATSGSAASSAPATTAPAVAATSTTPSLGTSPVAIVVVAVAIVVLAAVALLLTRRSRTARPRG